jgi:hypothetical protein
LFSTDRSTWFGHQSLFVRGRLSVTGVGDGIAGFSLSLVLSVAVFSYSVTDDSLCPGERSSESGQVGVPGAVAQLGQRPK